jgi:hypothetical protein
MKLKQLFLAIFATSVLFVSCTKEDVYDPIKPTSAVTSEPTSTVTSESSNMRVMSTPVTANKAYIFVEPITKFQTVKTYLLSLPKTPLYHFNFTGFFGVNADAWKYTYQNYVDMPYWNNGTLPSIIESNIPQTSGGVDSYGNPKLAYCFETIKIPKNTAVGMSWITILIPVSAMNDDTKRLRTVYSYQKNATTGALITNGSWKGFTYTMDNVLFSHVINYQGNRLPKGLYRLYSTYPGTGLRAILNTTNDYYLRGNSAL